MNQLQSELKKFLVVFTPYVRRYYSAKIKNSAKYPNLIARFYKDLEEFSGGGKKLRAFLVYLGYRIGNGENIDQVLPISLAVELIHNFLLIQDDIIDKSETRRGKPAIHKQYEKIAGSSGSHYGVSQAIVLADIACFEAFDLINSSNFDSQLKTICASTTAKILLETGYGEALDIEFSFRKPKLEDIKQIADLKTAKYSFVGPLTIGAALAGANKAQLKAIKNFGLKVGLAFQLQDDILGVFGDEKIIGKSPLSDMREGKNTMLIHKAREMADKKTLAHIENIWGRHDSGAKDLAAIKKILKSTGTLSWCQAENQKLAAKAKGEIAKITADKNLQIVFSQIADFVITREK